ncbi:MAG: mannose-1-phosphate guanylyltransferase [Opitutae bacterium]|nr:mannose-1-phosphate guanylyltransferase [Opitutae bacterium]|tara:strand:- start:2034 stop:2702 length:669 start_codon:yes stop_codon:yes gene_type:complete
MKTMILAAGYGKRLRPLTDQIPKPLVEVGGKPLITYHLEKLAASGCREIVINLGHLGSKIPEALGDGSAWGVKIEYSDEGPDPLETGGGLAKALPLLGDEVFLVVNGDVWCDLDFASIPKALPANDDALLYLTPMPAWRERGDFGLSAEERVTEDDNPKLLYTGIALYHPRILDGAKVEKFSIVPRLKASIARNRVGGILHEGTWDDVGTPERLEALRQSQE